MNVNSAYRRLNILALFLQCIIVIMSTICTFAGGEGVNSVINRRGSLSLTWSLECGEQIVILD